MNYTAAALAHVSGLAPWISARRSPTLRLVSWIRSLSRWGSPLRDTGRPTGVKAGNREQSHGIAIRGVRALLAGGLLLSFAVSAPMVQAQSCTPVLNPTSASLPAAGGSGFSVSVTIASGCVTSGSFFAKSNVPWIHLTGGINPQPDGSVQYFGPPATVTYSVDPNPNPTTDIGTITIAGRTFTVTQAGNSPSTSCTPFLNPTSASIGAAGGSGSVHWTVATPSTCFFTQQARTATSNASWLRLVSSSGSSGQLTFFGNPPIRVNYSVDPNPGATRTGTITIEGLTFRVTQAGSAPPPTSATATAVEYYWAARDHYFVTANPAEITALDASLPGGWVRTGLTFGAFAGPTAGANPVCRFYIPPIYGDSHYYSASPTECAAVIAAFPGFVFEAPNVFYIVLPNTTTGACPAGTAPVYRLWSNRADTNHRYTTSVTVRNQMLALGWVPEGYGANLVIMCAPS